MDPTDYEEERLKTLEFFMEKLKNKSRSVIQLTSLYGSKDFTPSMRRFVGVKHTSLRKFLACYPTIFHIENGIVTLKETLPATLPKFIYDKNKKSDVQEAKDYFRKKLLVLKMGKSMPIVNLHGHRSQAPLNVRTVSGRSVVELRKFLCKYPETFTVIGNEVSLAQTDDLKIYAEKRNKSVNPVNDEKFNECMTEIPRQLTQVFPLDIIKSSGKIEKEKIDSYAQTMNNNIHHLLVSSLKESKNKETDFNLKRGFALHFKGTWKAWRKSLITNVEDCNSITHTILKSAANYPVIISVSCKGGCCNAKYQLTLLQIATTRGEALIFDIMTCPEMMTKGGLKNLLESKNVIKIIHNCSTISAHLHRDFGVLLNNVLDTQSVHAVLQLQKYQIPVSEVQKVQIRQVCDLFGAPVNPLQMDLKKVLLRDEHYWTRRPLSPDMLFYAVADSLTLINERICMGIREILPKYHYLLSELCIDQILRYISPKEVSTREEKRRTNLEVVDLPELIDKRTISSNHLTEEKQEEPERLKEIHTMENRVKMVENIESDSDHNDFERKFEETSKVLDMVHKFVDSVEILSSISSESPDHTDVSNLIDSINVDIISGIMDDLGELIDFTSADTSGQVSTTLSGTDASMEMQDIEGQEAPKIPLIDSIDLTVEEEPPDIPKKKIEILSIEYLPNMNSSMIQNNENSSAGLNVYDSVLVRSFTGFTDAKNNAMKRSCTEVIWQNEETPPEKHFCPEPGIMSPAFSDTDDTDETTSTT